MKLYFLAILKPTTEELIKLLDRDISCINTANIDNPRTLLSFAAGLNKIDMMVSLLDYGADINAKNMDGSTALFHAARNDKAEALTLLLESHKGTADTLIRDNVGKSCLHYTKSGSICLALLVAKMTNIVNEDPIILRREQAAKIIKAVFRSTTTELLAQIGVEGGADASLEDSMSASLAALGLGVSGKKAATEFFAPVKKMRHELVDATRGAQLFTQSLINYMKRGGFAGRYEISQHAHTTLFQSML